MATTKAAWQFPTTITCAISSTLLAILPPSIHFVHSVLFLAVGLLVGRLYDRESRRRRAHQVTNGMFSCRGNLGWRVAVTSLVMCGAITLLLPISRYRDGDIVALSLPLAFTLLIDLAFIYRQARAKPPTVRFVR